MTDYSPHLENLVATVFQPLSRDLGLASRDVLGALAAGELANVAVFLEEDRGLSWLAIGASGANRPLCSVEEIAARFPRMRVMSEGTQRLSLAEQADFLKSRWGDLQVMFSADHLPETLAWHQAAARAYTKRFTKRP
jgi:hypothetical protein